MNTARTKRAQAPALAMDYGAVGTGVRVNGRASISLVPSECAKTALPEPASDIYKLTAEENARFVHLVTACAQITTHYELFLLARGALQFFLPHDILIAAWGDFRARDPQFDVISNIPGMRTNRVCNKIVLLAKRQHKIWINGGSQPIVLNKGVRECRACSDDACAQPCALLDMRLTVAHGIRNKRDGCDSLYIALRPSPFAKNGAEARSRFLAHAVIHQIDVAYRKVAALHTATAPFGERPPSNLLSVLSAREEEITNWVCQGKTNGEIGQILGISVNTVKNHVHRIFDKLGANNRTQAVAKYRDTSGRAESHLAGGSQYSNHSIRTISEPAFAP
jgi:transcriptional regulator EpsA